MKELGEVIRIEGDYAVVRVDRHGACGSCTACSMGSEGRKFIELNVLNTVDAKESDMVELDMEAPDLLFAAFILYGVPLLAMLGAVVLSYYVFAKDNVVITSISAFIAVVVAFLIIRLNEGKIKASNKFVPRISHKINV